MTLLGLFLVGGVGLALSALGLLYNIVYFPLLLSVPAPADAPYYRPALMLMLAASTALQIALVVICVPLCGGESAWAYTLAQWSGAVVAYLFAIQVIARLAPRSIRLSMASAFGVANTGLALNLFTAYPLWAPILALILHWSA